MFYAEHFVFANNVGRYIIGCCVTIFWDCALLIILDNCFAFFRQIFCEVGLMEQLIAKLAAGSPGFLVAQQGSTTTNKGLDKVLALAGLSDKHVNHLYGIYLDNRNAAIKIKGRLLFLAGEWFPDINKVTLLKVVNGAFKALKTNAYKPVDCYKCDGVPLADHPFHSGNTQLCAGLWHGAGCAFGSG